MRVPMFVLLGLMAGAPCLWSVAQGADDASSSVDRLFTAMRHRVPSGSWSSWTAEQRQAASRVAAGCVMLGMMATPGDEKPSDRTKMAAIYLTRLCQYHTMPADWPPRQKIGEALEAEYGGLHSDLPALPDPHLDAPVAGETRLAAPRGSAAR